MSLQESLKVTFDELGNIHEQMSQAEKLVSSEHSSSILAIRDNIERLKADIQELSLLSNKVDDALKDVQTMWRKVGTLAAKSPGLLSAELTDLFRYNSYSSPK